MAGEWQFREAGNYILNSFDVLTHGDVKVGAGGSFLG
jgi:hypothetical protein